MILVDYVARVFLGRPTPESASHFLRASGGGGAGLCPAGAAVGEGHA